MIKKGPKEEQIFEKMLKRYKVKKERVEKDVKEIVGELEKRKIVVFKNKVVLFLIHEFKEKLIDYFF